VAWEDREWAKWTDEERDRFLGGRAPSTGRRRRSRSDSIWRGDVSVLELLAAVVTLCGLVAILASAVGSSAIQPNLPGFASPGPDVGGPWPGGDIEYFNAAPEHEWALRQAVDAWNRSGAGVRFVATTSDAAELVIKRGVGRPCGHGRATLGYDPRATVTVFTLPGSPGCDQYSAARVLAHELGHVLGLEHDDADCAAMNTSGSYRGSSRCPPSAPWEWRCRLLEVRDVLAATKLYGGTPVPERGPATCALSSDTTG
jgi:Metallo-peptidase family M12